MWAEHLLSLAEGGYVVLLVRHAELKEATALLRRHAV